MSSAVSRALLSTWNGLWGCGCMRAPLLLSQLFDQCTADSFAERDAPAAAGFGPGCRRFSNVVAKQKAGLLRVLRHSVLFTFVQSVRAGFPRAATETMHKGDNWHFRLGNFPVM